METKEIKIVPPDGYCIDVENSTFECIKFKPKKLTYEDITYNLFGDEGIYYLGDEGRIEYCVCDAKAVNLAISSTSSKQLQKLLALNKLINVAKYLNGDWEPDFRSINESKFYFTLINNNLKIIEHYTDNLGTTCFKSEELAIQAIEILGKETIKLALSQV